MTNEQIFELAKQQLYKQKAVDKFTAIGENAIIVFTKTSRDVVVFDSFIERCSIVYTCSKIRPFGNHFENYCDVENSFVLTAENIRKLHTKLLAKSRTKLYAQSYLKMLTRDGMINYIQALHTNMLAVESENDHLSKLVKVAMRDKELLAKLEEISSRYGFQALEIVKERYREVK